ncbi:hypothetical protein LY76DRAFT_191980 [Colletotrichum caudatum]|nr:hypothetical protein LY76DRAFT_191980 [Colletotrichum caudatum]
MLASDKHPGPRRFRRPPWFLLVPFRSVLTDLGTSGLLQTIGSSPPESKALGLLSLVREGKGDGKPGKGPWTLSGPVSGSL